MLYWRKALIGAAFLGIVQSGRVIDRLIDYRPPPYPVDKYTDREPYDYRRDDGDRVPTKPIALVEDVCTMLLDRDASFKPKLVTAEDVRAVLQIYASRDWRKLPALRPWTHSNFIRS